MKTPTYFMLKLTVRVEADDLDNAEGHVAGMCEELNSKRHYHDETGRPWLDSWNIDISMLAHDQHNYFDD